MTTRPSYGCETSGKDLAQGIIDRKRPAVLQHSKTQQRLVPWQSQALERHFPDGPRGYGTGAIGVGGLLAERLFDTLLLALQSVRLTDPCVELALGFH
jgi:hypothetical protein